MVWVVNATPWSIYPRQRDPAPIVHEAGWAQARSGQVRKISPLLGFDPRTAQPVASRYINYSILALSN